MFSFTIRNIFPLWTCAFVGELLYVVENLNCFRGKDGMGRCKVVDMKFYAGLIANMILSINYF